MLSSFTQTDKEGGGGPAQQSADTDLVPPVIVQGDKNNDDDVVVLGSRRVGAGSGCLGGRGFGAAVRGRGVARGQRGELAHSAAVRGRGIAGVRGVVRAFGLGQRAAVRSSGSGVRARGKSNRGKSSYGKSSCGHGRRGDHGGRHGSGRKSRRGHGAVQHLWYGPPGWENRSPPPHGFCVQDGESIWEYDEGQGWCQAV